MALADTAQLIVELSLRDEISLGLHGVNDQIGNLGDTIRVTAANAADDLGVKATNAVDTLGGAANRAGAFFEDNKGKIREFGRAGTELAIVAAALGPDFEKVLGPVGEFVHIAGDAGLVASAISDLGPAAASGIASLLGLGTASETAAAGIAREGAAAVEATPETAGFGAAAAAATPEVAGLGAAADAAATGGIGALVGVTAGLAAPLAIGAVVAGTMAVATQKLTDASVQAQIAGSNLTDEQKQQALAIVQNKKITDDLTQAFFEQRQGVDESRRGFALIGEQYDETKAKTEALAEATRQSQVAEVEFRRAQLDAAAAAEADAKALFDQQDEAIAAADKTDTLGRMLGTIPPAFDSIKDSAFAATGQLDGATNSADQLTTALNNIPTNIDVNIQYRVSTAPGFNPNAPAGSADANRANAVPTTGDPNALANAQRAFDTQQSLDAQRRSAAAAAASAAQSAANQAAQEAQRRAEALAAAYRDKVDTAFKNAENTATSLFDALHKRHQQAIDDAEALAQKNHDAAVQAIQDSLKAQEAANAAPVNAAEAAQQAIETARQQRDLTQNLVDARKALAQAQGTGDPTKIADAQHTVQQAVEALQSFAAQQAINALKNQQAAADAKAEAAAQQSTAKADADLAAAKAKQQADTDAEAKAAVKREADFERALSALKVTDVNAKKSPTEINADIAALEKRFGITTDALGFHHIADPVTQAITQGFTQAQMKTQFTVVFPPLTLNGRAVSNALTANANPSQAGSSRSGQTTARR